MFAVNEFVKQSFLCVKSHKVVHWLLFAKKSKSKFQTLVCIRIDSWQQEFLSISV